MNSSRILIADDDRTLRKGIKFELEESDYQVSEASSVQEAIDLLEKINFDLVITDLKIPNVSDGLNILQETKKLDSTTMVMVITGYGSIELAVQAMQAGADDFVTKDASIEEIKLKVEKLLHQHHTNVEYARIREENKRLRGQLEKKFRFENLIGQSKIFQETLKIVGKVAEDGHCTVLLQGESGTGKELFARAIHYNSPRRDYPYVVVNIAAVPETLLESELFGHVKGAFTDAIKDRNGKFKIAEGGTIFLDEIGDMPANLQIKLLRVLQEKTFEPLGSDTTLSANVRIIAASNQDLRQRIQEKTLREDLFYRLNVVPIKIPPLRERKGDVPILTDHFIQQFCQQRKKELKFSPKIRDCFQHYDWPGNIRELENVIEQMVVLATDTILGYQDLPESLKAISQCQEKKEWNDLQNMAKARAKVVSDFEKHFLAEALNKNAWNVSQTAKAIGVSREGLHRMIKRYDLEKKSIVTYLSP